MPITSSPRTVLITGCSTGFGWVTALHMAQLGWRVFATVRKEADQACLLAEAEHLHCQELLVPLLCDITNQVQVEHLREVVSQTIPHLDVLVNNAGTAFAAPVELLELDDLRQQIEINVIAQVGITQAFLPLLKKAQGTIINMSSVSGRYAPPTLGPYAASKYALEALSDALRVELAPFGVQVVLLEPGSSTTQIWTTSRQRSAKLEQHRDGPYGPLLASAEQVLKRSERHGFAPELVAQTIVKIVNQPRARARYLIPARESLLIFIRKFITDRMWDKQMRRVMRW